MSCFPPVSHCPSPTSPPLSEDGPSVTSSQLSLKAAVDKGGDIKVTPDERQRLSSSFPRQAAEFFFSSFLSSLFFSHFISAAFSPLCPLSVFSRRHPPRPPRLRPSERRSSLWQALIFLGARVRLGAADWARGAWCAGAGGDGAGQAESKCRSGHSLVKGLPLVVVRRQATVNGPFDFL